MIDPATSTRSSPCGMPLCRREHIVYVCALQHPPYESFAAIDLILTANLAQRQPRLLVILRLRGANAVSQGEPTMVRSTNSLGVLAAMTMTLLPCMARAADLAPGGSGQSSLQDISGTYIDASTHGECDLRATSGGASDAARVVTVVYWQGLLTLRVLPTRTIRMLHIQRRPLLTGVSRADYHNGLARWESGDLVVESAVPALPLWSRPRALGAASTLVERFSFSESALTYRASYRLAAGGASVDDPFELTL